MTKKEILDAIRDTALENGGIPLGRDRFERESGISNWQISKYWPRFSDALKEAGFEPNEFNSAYEEELILKSLVDLCRELKHFPVRGEMRVKRHKDPSFPTDSVFYRRFGRKEAMAQKLSEYSEEKGYFDVVEMCTPIIAAAKSKKVRKAEDSNYAIGEVYLFKSGKYYKIGKTNDTVRRGTELKIQLPEKLDLIHSIKTDDPSGVEAYWHRRFESKRMNGEWFDLTSVDIKAFKRWRRIA